MAKSNKISLPSGGGGLISYSEDEDSFFKIGPREVVVLSILILVGVIVLHIMI
ncbi:MAG: preprotein translocase subunit Sec61beta [Candidatus Woesearchaeota archaeon]